MMECYDKNGWALYGSEKKQLYKKPIVIKYTEDYKKRTGCGGRFGIILAYISAEDVYFTEPGETKLHRTKRDAVASITEDYAY